MKGYIVYPNYELIESHTYVKLFGRLENEESFLALIKIEPYFFIKAQDLQKASKYLSNFKTQKTDLTNFAKEKLMKISSENHIELNKLYAELEKSEIKTYEADLKPHARFLIDNNLLGTIEIKGDYAQGEKVNRIYKNPQISSATFKPKLKVASIDLESDKTLNKLYCIGIYSPDYKQNFMITNEKNLKNVTPCESEKDCLEKFKQAIIKLDPDIITGWNLIDFDLDYLQKLFKKYKLAFDLGRDENNVRIRIESNFFRSSTADMSGRQVLDGLNMIKDPFLKEAPSIKNIEFESYTLEDVSQAILGSGKLLKGKERHNEIDELYNKKEHQKLADYNLVDCELAYKILDKTDLLNLAIERSQLTGMSLERISSSIAAFDSLYIREARKRNLASPTMSYGKKEEKIKGGYVFSSNSGIYHNVITLDFKSLYPSILKTFNIDPASLLPHKEKDSIQSPNGAYFRNDSGILPEIIGKLHQAREKAKKEKRELANYAIKTTMNCFSPDTEVLTENGLKNIEGVDVGERVYTINPSNNNVELRQVTKKFFYPYKGKMIKIKSNAVDYLVTPNHRFLVNLGEGYEWKEAKELYKEKKYFWLPEHVKINGEIVNEIDIENMCKKFNIVYRKKGDKLQKAPKHSSIPSKFRMQDWLQLMGWYLSEGHIYTSSPKKYTGKVSWRGITKIVMFNQKTKKYRGDIINLLREMGLKYCIQFNGISINNHIIAEILEKECGIGSNWKHIPRWIYYLDHSLLMHLFNSMMKGDGDKNGQRYSTISVNLAKDFLQLVHHLGIYGFIYEEERHRKRDYTMYRIQVNKNRGIVPYISPRRNMREEDFEGEVLCIEVPPNHTVLAGRNKKLNFCGQSFWGVLASPNCRYFNFDMANAITHFARWIIQLTAKKIEGKGHKVIYQDTDSVFVVTNLEKNKADKLGEELQEYVNNFYKHYIKEHYKRESYLELEFDKQYFSLMIPNIRGLDTQKAAKKRYAGLIEENGKEILDIVGLEAIRGDWTDAAQEFQKELLLKTFKKEPIEQFIKSYIKRIREGKLDEKLIYRKSIRKELEEYTKTTPPHVKAARQLDSLDSTIIQYYITLQGPQPIQKLRSKIDYDHYIEKQIKPVANQVLALLGKNFDDLLKGSTQKTLF